MIPPTPKSKSSAAVSDLLATATADFRANLKHSRALSLLIDHYLKQGLSTEQVRLAVRSASTAPTRPIRVILPAGSAA